MQINYNKGYLMVDLKLHQIQYFTYSSVMVLQVPQKTIDPSQVNDKLYHIMLYRVTSPLAEFDCTGCCKSNYHTITMAPSYTVKFDEHVNSFHTRPFQSTFEMVTQSIVVSVQKIFAECFLSYNSGLKMQRKVRLQHMILKEDSQKTSHNNELITNGRLENEKSNDVHIDGCWKLQ